MRRQQVIDFWTQERERLIRYVRRLRDDTADRDGEDVVQDVMESILRQLDVIGPIQDISAYVYRALKNRVVDIFRKKRDTVSLDAAVFDDDDFTLSALIADTAPDALDELIDSEIRLQILEAVESLGPEQKAVVIETEFFGRTYRELSEAWNVPIGTLLARKKRALERIRESLDDLEDEFGGEL